MNVLRDCAARAVVFCALAAATLAQAAPPGTIVYQGRLSDANGNPQDGNFTIELRLYDVPTAGAFLWNESQTVAVDDGFYSVTLGDTTPLPPELFAQRLWLGIDVNGDGEMTPRPALSAAPFALRALTVMRNIVYVAADGTPVQNGTALIAAMNAIQGNTAANGYTVFVDAGTFDLGAVTLAMKPFVDLVGQGRERTIVTSAANGPTVSLANSTGVAAMHVRATGPTVDANSLVSAIEGPNGVQGLYLRDLLADSEHAGSTLGFRFGIRLVGTRDNRVEDVIASSSGGNFSYGLATTSGAAGRTERLKLRNVTGIGRGAITGTRGIDIAAFNDVDAQDVTGRAEGSGASAATHYGVRFQVGDGLNARNVVAYAGGADLVSSATIVATIEYYLNDSEVAGLTALAEGTGTVVEGLFVQAETFETSVPAVFYDRPRIFDARVRANGKATSTTIGMEVWGAAPLLERATIEARNPDAPNFIAALNTKAIDLLDGNRPLNLQDPFEIRDSSFVQDHPAENLGCGICADGANLVLQNVRVESRDGPLNIGQGGNTTNPARAVVATNSQFVTERPAVMPAINVFPNASFRSAHGTFSNGVFVEALGTAECAASVVTRAPYAFQPIGCSL